MSISRHEIRISGIVSCSGSSQARGRYFKVTERVTNRPARKVTPMWRTRVRQGVTGWDRVRQGVTWGATGCDMGCYRAINVKNEARLRRKTATRRQKAKKWGGPAALNWHSTSKSKGNCRNRIDISKGNCQDSDIFLDTQCHIQLAAGAKIYRNVFNKISISKGNYQHFSKK